ncbi:hypothetical protein [Actinoallomurus sp. NPDC052274]|uniref:Mom family adenine methylcarbamoylation protein n=1 Tax=Actinoallomurus sp. NPDC052274 TaxID=3155420 RepID=UPI003436D9E7
MVTDHGGQLALPFPEVPTASPQCQRWRGGRHSWRHAEPGTRFDARRYEVHPIEEAEAKAYVTAAHYSGSYPAARLRYGLYERGRLVGAAVFGVPMGRRVLPSVLPSLVPAWESLELSRFVLDDVCPGNSESWFLARCFEALLGEGVRGVVSFADPVPRRRADGTLVMPGHVGWIYQATNSVYTGRSTPRTVSLLPDGTVLNDRAKQKVRRQEPGHAYVEKSLIALGARVPRAGEDPRAWLVQALEDVGARPFRHRGCHRYVFRLGRTRREREAIELGRPARPYPKRIDIGLAA